MVSCKHSALCGPTQSISVPRLGVVGAAVLGNQTSCPLGKRFFVALILENGFTLIKTWREIPWQQKKSLTR